MSNLVPVGSSPRGWNWVVRFETPYLDLNLNLADILN